MNKIIKKIFKAIYCIVFDHIEIRIVAKYINQTGNRKTYRWCFKPEGHLRDFVMLIFSLQKRTCKQNQ